MQGLNPEIFRWARESAGMDVPSAAGALKIKDATLEGIECGDGELSRSLLLRMTKVYRRSLLTFYLPTPPIKGSRGQDYRTVSAEYSVSSEAQLDALVRDIKARQAVIRSVLEEEDEISPLDFVGSASMRFNVTHLADEIKSRIGFSKEEFRAQRSSEEAFGWLRSQVESAGVFILLIGNLGSHHSSIPVETFRGFAIADDMAPFVVINDQDAKTAWSFTLLHELVHIWLGASGISGGVPEQKIEQYCNSVAAELLVSSDEISGLDVLSKSLDEQLDLITARAQEWKVSRQMLAYGLFKVGLIDRATWQVLDRRFREQWAADRIREKERNREEGRQGPSYYVVRRHRLGRAMLRFARNGLDTGVLTPTKAAKVLGVAPRSVFPLLNSVSI